MKEKSDNKLKIESSKLIPLSFLMAIIIGTFLLMLPVSTADGETTSLLTALFTATTSICVTGLVVVDTFSHWSLFGKIVILIMIQLGGLGIISVTSILMLMINKKFSLEQSVLLHDAFNLNSVSGLMKFLAGVFKGTFAVEGVGALVYMITFIPKYGPIGIWYAVFTSISAFCNAGIDILGPDSLIGFNDNPLVILNTTMLIVMGGLGYVVWFDFINGVSSGRKKGYPLKLILRRLSEHTRLVINITVLLIISGMIGVFALEYNNPETIGNMSMGYKILTSMFQSVTFRKAGFAGGSPVGTAGGVKTVTFVVVFLNAISFIRNRNENVVCKRKVTSDLIHKASAIILVSFMVTFILLILLLATNDISLVDGMYEMFSATATVGLSRALTPTLNAVGKLIIIVAMFLGRIGPISMALFFKYNGAERNNVSFAKDNFFVG